MQVDYMYENRAVQKWLLQYDYNGGLHCDSWLSPGDWLASGGAADIFYATGNFLRPITV